MNRLFVANKPSGTSSNRYLREIKKKYGVKKAGYSGTLDPFASGCLIVAFGQYTKLFRFLKKEPKSYEATLHLGAKSETLDNEKIEYIDEMEPFTQEQIEEVLKSFIGEIEYLPPKYSAKKINGKKAYNLARANQEFEMKKIKSTIYGIELLSYNHPFVTFDITISEGGYIRSIAYLIAQKLGCEGSLSALYRSKEGDFAYEDEKCLNPLSYLKTKENRYKKEISDIILGKKLQIEDFEIKEEGEYHIVTDQYFSIIKIEDQKVEYILNKIRLDEC